MNILEVISIPHWMMSIVYFLTAISFMFMTYMPFSIRVSIVSPIVITGCSYVFLALFPTTCFSQHNIIDFCNLTIMIVILINSLFFIHFRNKKGN